MLCIESQVADTEKLKRQNKWEQRNVLYQNSKFSENRHYSSEDI